MGARILVIEDNDDSRQLMTYLLEHAGHSLALAEGGESGLKQVAAEVPDLVLLDLHMPGMDGFQVIEALKQERRMNGVPIVAVTAVAMVGDREAVIKAGFDGYIPKPIAPETFAEEVEAFLPADKAAAEGGAS